MTSHESSNDTEPARLIADAVLACPDVAALSRGPFGTVATYLPGAFVGGVAVRDDEVEVHVVAHYGRPVPEIAARVRDIVTPYAGDREVTVVVDDIDIGAGVGA
ncbi:MAG TPA: hypothetical protein VGL93_30570 [Streptosporangiaceae bacterium]|jgi:uncharacterized alkaline shock family protein YloU